jgi:hypothetical protein
MPVVMPLVAVEALPGEYFPLPREVLRPHLLHLQLRLAPWRLLQLRLGRLQFPTWGWAELQGQDRVGVGLPLC